MKYFKLLSALFLSMSVFAVANASTLDEVKARGKLRCGVSQGLSGFSAPDASGRISGLDADTCRAVAAAVLGNANAVEFVKLTAKERFTATSSGEIDMLSRNTTWTATRDNSLGLNFTGVNYYDGQGFLVKKSLGVNSALQLDGASACVQAGTTTELNLSDWAGDNGLSVELITFNNSEETKVAFEAGRCDVLTSDQSQLAALRTGLADPDSAVVLPEVISKEPLGPVVRHGDDQWFDIVKWVLFAMYNAEELGINSSNVSDKKVSANVSKNVQRLLGTSGNAGEQLGLSSDWAFNVIKQVGNYGEVFERNVGKGSPLQLPRGVNALWKNGGLIYGPPIR